MLNLFTLWCAIRKPPFPSPLLQNQPFFSVGHTTGSFYIVGEEKLGMLPEYVDISYPLIGRVSVPRMIVAQFDTLNYVWVLERFKNKLLRDIDWLLLQNDNRWWFTLYLIVFILLREASLMTLDRYRHARANFGSKVSTWSYSCFSMAFLPYTRSKNTRIPDPWLKHFDDQLLETAAILYPRLRREPPRELQQYPHALALQEQAPVAKIARPQDQGGNLSEPSHR